MTDNSFYRHLLNRGCLNSWQSLPCDCVTPMRMVVILNCSLAALSGSSFSPCPFYLGEVYMLQPYKPLLNLKSHCRAEQKATCKPRKQCMDSALAPSSKRDIRNVSFLLTFSAVSLSQLKLNLMFPSEYGLQETTMNTALKPCRVLIISASLFFPSRSKLVCILSAFGKSKQTNRRNSCCGKAGPEACRKVAAFGEELHKTPRGPRGASTRSMQVS